MRPRLVREIKNRPSIMTVSVGRCPHRLGLTGYVPNPDVTTRVLGWRLSYKCPAVIKLVKNCKGQSPDERGHSKLI